MGLYIVTGGAGFIGSAFVWKLNQEGIDDILLVDNLGASEKWKNLVGKRFLDYLHKDAFLKMVQEDRLPGEISAIIHMGACSSTAERNADYLMENNYRYSRALAEWAAQRDIRFLYASSAATYGGEVSCFSDSDEITQGLRPLNIYGYSKHLFDLFALRSGLSRKIVGVKFFNVFGPNEGHKGEMTSVVFKAFHQIQETGKVQLFQSHRVDYADGEQQRDFVYVKDCVEVMWWLLEHPEVNGAFNLGTGQARTWNALAKAVFSAMGRDPMIEYIPMPGSLPLHYQYFTQAKMDKLRLAGCSIPFRPLEEAVQDYVANYLQKDQPL